MLKGKWIWNFWLTEHYTYTDCGSSDWNPCPQQIQCWSLVLISYQIMKLNDFQLATKMNLINWTRFPHDQCFCRPTYVHLHEYSNRLLPKSKDKWIRKLFVRMLWVFGSKKKKNFFLDKIIMIITIIHSKLMLDIPIFILK